MVYDAVHDSYLYRLKTIAGVIKHLNEILTIVSSGFTKHVPEADGGGYGALLPEGFSLQAIRSSQRAAQRLTTPGQATYSGVPRRELVDMAVGLVRSQGPSHRPAGERLPAFAARWFRRYEEDPNSAARWYSVGAAHR